MGEKYGKKEFACHQTYRSRLHENFRELHSIRCSGKCSEILIISLITDSLFAQCCARVIMELPCRWRKRQNAYKNGYIFILMPNLMALNAYFVIIGDDGSKKCNRGTVVSEDTSCRQKKPICRYFCISSLQTGSEWNLIIISHFI